MSRKMRNLLALVLALLLVSPDLAVLAEEIAALRLPSSLKVIEEEAFYGDTSIGKVIVPEGATEIGERAFANSSLTEINLPDTLTSIADTAFEGLTDVTVTANEGSWAYGWATDKGYITASGFDLASLFVDAGRIVKRNGSAYWEAVPGTSNSSRAVGLEVDGDWSMSTDESWISIELTQPEDHIFNVSFKENRTGAKRTGTIRIATETDAKNLTVEQLPYLEARVVSPEALARDGKYEAYYDEEQDMFIDPKDGDYPVLSFGDIEVVYDADAGTRVAGFYFNTPTWEEGGQQYVGDSLRVSDTIPRYALVAGATGSQWLHTISLDLTDEEGNEYSTRYAFYVFGDSDWIAGYAIDEDSGEVLGVKIMGYAYAVEDAELAIPDTLWGDPVVQIGVRAFMENGYLTSVVIPNTVTSIEYEAFAYCENLTSVTLPESVTYIDDSAFDQCPKLKEINAVEGSYAYDWAMDHGLISREEPAILESAHPYAAGTDEEWTYQYDGSAYGLKVTFSELTSFCPNSDDMLVITDANGEEIAYTGYKLTGRSMFLPGTSFHLQLYTENEEGRYFGFRITAIEPLTEAEYKAQKNDFQFGTRTRADGTLRIVYCAGSADDSTELAVPETIGGRTVTAIGDGAFDNCGNLTAITLPDSITSIGKDAFATCSGLVSINLPDGISSIEAGTFSGCTDLTALTIPNGVTFIGDSAFAYCSSLTSLTIPEGVSAILPETFYGCSGLTNLVLPSSITSIGHHAFSACSGLTTLTIPDGVKSIDGDAFSGCEGLTSIVLPDSVETIGEYLFEDCTSLTDVTLPKGLLAVSNYAFYGCSSLTNVQIPDTVTSVGYCAFRDCIGLTEVTIAEGVQSIQSAAFKGCSALTSVHLPASVTFIDDSAFDGCPKVTIDAPAGSYAYAWAKKYAETRYERQFSTGTLSDGTLMITGFTNNDETVTDVRIPGAIGGVPVTSIGSYAFLNCSSLTSIDIPDGVTSIGGSAFSGCSNLTSVNIPDGVTKIGARAFRSCTSLAGINIPDGVTNIDEEAFYECASLTSVNIPDGVTKIGDKAFRSCASLTSINIPDSVTSIGYDVFYKCSESLVIYGKAGSYAESYAKENGLTFSTEAMINEDEPAILESAHPYTGNKSEEWTYTYDGSTLGLKVTFSRQTALRSGDTLTITDAEAHDVEYIEGQLAGKTLSLGGTSFTLRLVSNSSTTGFGFRITQVEPLTEEEYAELKHERRFNTITLPAGTKEITGYIGNDETITDVRVPSTIDGLPVTSIGSKAFAEHSELTSIILPDSVTNTGEEAFSGCTSLTNVNIPDGVTYIRSHAFSGCSGLTSINIPDGIMSIGEKAFSGCASLTSVNVPDSVTYISYRAFKDCSGLTSINIPDGVTSIYEGTFSGCSSLTSIDIPDGVTSIGDWAFSSCNDLTSINIPDGVTSIGWYAFSGCSSLTSINIPDGVTSIYEGTFSGCSSLTNINIPDNVTSIGPAAFRNCSSLTSINIPNSVTSIGHCAFECCSSLTNINIPDGVTSIEYRTFSGCSSLTSINIPDGVMSIRFWAFEDCSNLTSINIPDGVTSIYEGAFYGCSSLTSINIPDGVTSIGNSAFRNCSSLTSINIPDGVTEIGKEAFDGCSSLTSVNIPDSVTSIGDAAFSLCYGLTSIDIPDSVTSIGDWVFNGCGSLTSINIPDGVTSIGYRAFSMCYDLTSINIPDGVTSIGDYAFMDCYDLTSIYIPDSVTSIGANAFNDAKDDLVIYGIAGSYAETYAEADSITFKAINSSSRLSIKPSSVALESAATTVTVTVRANTEWDFGTDCDWVTVTAEGNTSCSGGVVTIAVSENVGDMRFGNVIIYSDDHTRTLSIVQKGANTNKLADPIITYPAADGDNVPYGDVHVAWTAVENAGWYVISLRDLTTGNLMLHHSTQAMSSETTALLGAEYFFPGRDYRIAVGAVPAGFESTDPSVGWCERVIHVEPVEEETTASLSGKVMGNTVVSDSDTDGNTKERVESTPLENAMVVLVKVTEAEHVIAKVVRTDADGLWRIDDCVIGAEYLIYAMAGDDRDDVTSIDELEEGDLQVRFHAAAGENDTGVQTVNMTDDDEVVRVATDYLAGVVLQEGQKHGLWAEFFQGGKNERSASAKRWEASVSTIDFSWTDADIEVLHKNSNYNRLNVTHFNGSGSCDTVRYMKKDKMHVLFSGWLTVPESDIYSFRLTGDDGVRITITKPDGKKCSKDDGWLFGGKNQVAEVTIFLARETAYPISIEYYNKEGDANLKFEWKKRDENDSAYTIVPADYLYHNAASNRQVSIKNRSMETLAQMNALEKSIENTANNTILSMATGVVQTYVIGPAFDLSDNIYSTFSGQLVDTVVNNRIKAVCDAGVEIIIGKALDPSMSNYEIHETLLDAMPALKGYDGFSQEVFDKKLEAFKKDWEITTADSIVDIVAFFRQLSVYFPKAYAHISSSINVRGKTMDEYYAIISEEFMSESSFETAANGMIKKYKGAKGYYDYIQDCLKGVANYKDSNRIRSYLHLLYFEDQEEAFEYTNLIHIGMGILTGQYWVDDRIKREYVSALDECENGALIVYIGSINSKNGQDKTLILLYKQILNGAMRLASQQFRVF